MQKAITKLQMIDALRFELGRYVSMDEKFYGANIVEFKDLIHKVQKTDGVKSWDDYQIPGFTKHENYLLMNTRARWYVRHLS